jgi:hypothetical protein
VPAHDVLRSRLAVVAHFQCQDNPPAIKTDNW